MSPRILSVEPFDPRWTLSPGDYRQHYAHIPFDAADERALRSLQARALDAERCAPALPPAKVVPARKNAARKATRSTKPTKKKPTAP